MAEAKSNRFTRHFALLLDALRSTDPTPMRPTQAIAWIRARVDVPADDLTRLIVNGRESIFENDDLRTIFTGTRLYPAKAGLIWECRSMDYRRQCIVD